jgi:hypothetical protein
LTGYRVWQRGWLDWLVLLDDILLISTSLDLGLNSDSGLGDIDGMQLPCVQLADLRAKCAWCSFLNLGRTMNLAHWRTAHIPDCCQRLVLQVTRVDYTDCLNFVRDVYRNTRHGFCCAPVKINLWLKISVIILMDDDK